MAKPRSCYTQEVEFAVRGPSCVSWGGEDDARTRPGCCLLDLIFVSPAQVGELVFRNYYTAWVTVLVRTITTSNAGVTAIATTPGVTPTGTTGSSSTVASSGSAAAGAGGTSAATTGAAGSAVGVNRQNTRATTRSDEDSPGSWQVAIPRRILMPHPHQETGSHDVVSIAATESAIEWSGLTAIRLLLQQPSPIWRTFHVEEISVFRDLPRRIARLPPPGNSCTSVSSVTASPTPAAAMGATTETTSVAESRLEPLREQTSIALRKSNAPDREGPMPRDFVGLVGYEVQGLLQL